MLSHRRLPWLLAGLAIIACSPALFIGFNMDDWYILAVLRGMPAWPELRLPWWQMYSEVPGTPGALGRMLDRGMLPWWTSPELRVAFLRPLAAVTHLVDYRLFGLSARIPHLESLLLYAAVVVCAAAFFRRVMGAGLAAGLAAAFYALDEAHGFAVGWLANRNVLLGVLFGLMALITHVRWRRGGWKPGAWLGPLCLLLGLLSAEGTLAVTGYLLGFALFLETDRRKAILALIPQSVVAAGWLGVWSASGFGVRGSGLYLDPTKNPALFLRALLERVPLLLEGQWGPLPLDLDAMASHTLHVMLVLFSVLFLIPLVLLLLPVIRATAEGRFWALGSAIALLPVSSAFPMGRLLFFVGLGSMALLARAVEQAGFLEKLPLQGRAWCSLAGIFLFLHAVLGPLELPLAAYSPSRSHRFTDALERCVPSDFEMATDTLVLVNAPDFVGYVAVIRMVRGGVAPDRMRVLAPGYRPLTITRVGDRALRLRPDGGWFTYNMESLIRGDIRGFRPGDRVRVAGMEAEVTALTADARPAEAVVRFDKPLEDAQYRWFSWSNRRLVPFTPPASGQSVQLRGGLAMWR
jgi:hypothetical protein